MRLALTATQHVDETLPTDRLDVDVEDDRLTACSRLGESSGESIDGRRSHRR
jgi:hypothetical protein